LLRDGGRAKQISASGFGRWDTARESSQAGAAVI
jgi:hypothetical protein